VVTELAVIVALPMDRDQERRAALVIDCAPASERSMVKISAPAPAIWSSHHACVAHAARGLISSTHATERAAAAKSGSAGIGNGNLP
jgi:hypothetical protein